MSMIGGFLQVSPADLEALIADPSSMEGRIFTEDQECENGIEVDKAWHGIHYLLANDAWGGDPPLANAVLGGTAIGDDVGYGPVRYLTAEEVLAVANALKQIAPAEYRERYDERKLLKNQIYPQFWHDADDAAGYLLSWYEEMRSYYLDAATKGNAMLKYVI